MPSCSSICSSIARLSMQQHCQVVIAVALPSCHCRSNAKLSLQKQCQVVIAVALPSCHCSSIAKLSLQKHCQVVVAVALPSCHCNSNANVLIETALQNIKNSIYSYTKLLIFHQENTKNTYKMNILS